MTIAPADAETIARELESFLRGSFQIPDDDPFFTRTVDLFDQGYVDSAGVVETIAYLERRYALKLPEEIVFDPRFTHIGGIAHMIAEALGPAAGGQPGAEIRSG